MAGRPYTYHHGTVRQEVFEYVKGLGREFTMKDIKDRFDYDDHVLQGVVRWMHSSGMIRKCKSTRTGTPNIWRLT